MFIVNSIYFLAYIKPWAIILSYIFEKITGFSNVKVYFFLINNNCVNSKFLSRFIARKLKQNFPVRKLLSPIRKELNFVIKLSCMGKNSYFGIVDGKFKNFVNNKTTRNNIYKLLLTSLFNTYKKNLLKYFFFNKF
jgi:hypothetical protein